MSVWSFATPLTDLSSNPTVLRPQRYTGKRQKRLVPLAEFLLKLDLGENDVATFLNFIARHIRKEIH